MPTNRHDPDQKRTVWPPQPGYFELRLARQAWAVPCRILHTEDGWQAWQAVIDGIEREPDPDPAHAPDVARIWHGGTIIDEDHYRWLFAVKSHAERHDPDHPSLHPLRPIDPMRLRPLVF